MKKSCSIVKLVSVLCIASALVGCQTSSSMHAELLPDQQGPLRRTFALPPAKAPSLTRGREKLVGQWKKNVIIDCRSVVAELNQSQTIRMTYTEIMNLKADGTCSTSSGETKTDGTWSYAGNTLVIRQGGAAVDYRLTWYGDNEFLARLADPGKSVRSGIDAKWWYDDEGCLRGKNVFSNGFVSETIASPDVYIRLMENVR